MPIKLYPPDSAHPNWRVRGKYLGIHVHRSTGTREKSLAQKIFAKWKAEIERGAYAGPTDPTFASAALSYMQAGGDATFLEPLIRHFGARALLERIEQADVDAAAVALHPNASPATRNRAVYTPFSAVRRHAGIDKRLRRPKGARGKSRLCWLSPEQALALIVAADARADRIEQHVEEKVAGAVPQIRGIIRNAAIECSRGGAPPGKEGGPAGRQSDEAHFSIRSVTLPAFAAGVDLPVNGEVAA
jgi:hypothetical protein